MSSQVPGKLNKGEVGVVTGKIKANNSNPQEVWDSAFLRAEDTVYLRYVTASAIMHNGGSANGMLIGGEALFSEDGAYIAYYGDKWGFIPGCNEFAGYVTYDIKVEQLKSDNLL
jgi:hypothetical protein